MLYQEQIIRTLLDRYKRALLLGRMYQEITGLRCGPIPLPELEAARRQYEPPLEEAFAVYEQEIERGSLPESAAQAVLDKLG